MPTPMTPEWLKDRLRFYRGKPHQRQGIRASLEMASSFPRCKICQLLVHTYPAGHKGPGAEGVTVFYGRRGRPVKKPRFIPMERAHHWARKLQARTISSQRRSSTPSRWSRP